MSDLRSEQSPVIDQGARPTCASCAVTSAHEWVQQKLPLSVEDVIHNAKRFDPWPGDEATSVLHAIEGLTAHGQAIGATWPYGNPRFPSPPPHPSTLPSNRKLLPSGVSFTNHRSVEEVLLAVENGCAILTLHFVPDAWESADAYIDAPPGSPVSDLHAVLAVGTAQRRNAKAVVVKNSWGTGWGDAGYGYLSIPYLRSYLLSAHVLKRAA